MPGVEPLSGRGELTISKNNAAIRGGRAAAGGFRYQPMSPTEVSERRVEGAHATSAAGTDLVLGDDLGVGVECAAVEDPVADALEGELAGGSCYANLVAEQADGEKRSDQGAEKTQVGGGEIASGAPAAKVDE